MHRRPHIAALADFQQMPRQAKSGDVGHGMHAIKTSQHRPRGIQLRCGLDHRLVIIGMELILFQRCAVHPDTELLAEDQFVARLGTRVALEVGRIDDADGDQPVNRLDRVDGVAAGDWDAGGAAYGLATLQNLAEGFKGENEDGEMEVWVTKDPRISYWRMAGASSSMKQMRGVMPGSHPDGMLLEVRSRDKKSGDTGRMTITAIDTKAKVHIDMNEYPRLGKSK